MNTRILMTASSVALGAAGVVASFAPSELLTALGAPSGAPLPVLIQLIGALYVGFALTNWMAKDSLIGGIYARPISIGNCVHFVSGALALAKHQSAQAANPVLLTMLVMYVLFAIGFTWLAFGYAPAPTRSR